MAHWVRVGWHEIVLERFTNMCFLSSKKSCKSVFVHCSLDRKYYVMCFCLSICPSTWYAISKLKKTKKQKNFQNNFCTETILEHICRCHLKLASQLIKFVHNEPITHLHIFSVFSFIKCRHCLMQGFTTICCNLKLLLFIRGWLHALCCFLNNLIFMRYKIAHLWCNLDPQPPSYMQCVLNTLRPTFEGGGLKFSNAFSWSS